MSTAGTLPKAGTLTTIDVFVGPSDTGKYLELSSACSKLFLAEPGCESVECLQNPEDPGHIRIALAYKDDPEWYYKIRATEWFQEFHQNVKPLWIKPPIFQHLNRIPWNYA